MLPVPPRTIARSASIGPSASCGSARTGGRLAASGGGLRPVRLVDEPETGESKVGVHHVDDGRFRGDELRKAPRGDDAGPAPQLSLEPGDHPFHEADVAPENAGLDSSRRILADSAPGAGQLHAVKLG